VGLFFFVKGQGGGAESDFFSEKFVTALFFNVLK